jgi:hypothetical protein
MFEAGSERCIDENAVSERRIFLSMGDSDTRYCEAIQAEHKLIVELGRSSGVAIMARFGVDSMIEISSEWRP